MRSRRRHRRGGRRAPPRSRESASTGPQLCRVCAPQGCRASRPWCPRVYAAVRDPESPYEVPRIQGGGTTSPEMRVEPAETTTPALPPGTPPAGIASIYGGPGARRSVAHLPWQRAHLAPLRPSHGQPCTEACKRRASKSLSGRWTAWVARERREANRQSCHRSRMSPTAFLTRVGLEALGGETPLVAHPCTSGGREANTSPLACCNVHCVYALWSYVPSCSARLLCSAYSGTWTASAGGRRCMAGAMRHGTS